MTPTATDDEERESNPIKQEKIRLFLKTHVLKILVLLLVITGLVIWFCMPKSSSITKEVVDHELQIDELKRERDRLKVKLKLSEIQAQSLSNNISELEAGSDKLIGIIVSNRMSSSTSSPTSSIANTNVVTTTQTPSPITVENPNKIGVGLVTVNDNHGDIKITIKNGDGGGGLGSRRSNGPDTAEDFVRGLLKAEGNELPIQSEKIIPAKGNGVRYYIPEGWTVNYKYYCSEDDLEVFLNATGTREAPVWTRIEETAIRDKIESIWIRNLSKRNIRISFNIFPKNAK